MLKALTPQDNNIITENGRRDYSLTIVKLHLHNGGVQSITTKNFLALSLHPTSKTESLLRKPFLYLLKHIMLTAEIHLYLSQLRKKLIAITLTLYHIGFQIELLSINRIPQYVHIRIILINTLKTL